MSVRAKRIGQEIRKVLSAKLLRDYKEEIDCFISIGEVEVNKDLTHAKVFFTVFGSEEDGLRVKKVLDGLKPRLRFEVGKEIKLRTTPDLAFVLDSSPQHAQKISDLLNKNQS